MDALYLEYLMKTKGITRTVLAEAQDWSSSTCSRKVAGTSEWDASEIKALKQMGFSMEEVEKIFFS